MIFKEIIYSVQTHIRQTQGINNEYQANKNCNGTYVPKPHLEMFFQTCQHIYCNLYHFLHTNCTLKFNSATKTPNLQLISENLAKWLGSGKKNDFLFVFYMYT